MLQYLAGKFVKHMPDSNKFYAVTHGRKIGIFDSWDICKQMVDGFSNARYKSFKTREEAELFIRKNGKDTSLRSIPINADGKALSSGRAAASAVALATRRVSRSPVKSPAEGRKRHRSSPDPVQLSKFSEDWIIAREEEATVVYVDGACSANGRSSAQAGFGGFYTDGDPRNFSFALCATEAQTNNRAELHALIYVVRAALECEGGCANLYVYTDSKYVLEGATTYLRRWLSNGFKLINGKPVLNQDLWSFFAQLREQHTTQYAARLVAEHKLSPADARDAAERLALRILYVPGHSGVRGNEMADRLAVRGAAGEIKRPPLGKEET